MLYTIYLVLWDTYVTQILRSYMGYIPYTDDIENNFYN